MMLNIRSLVATGVAALLMLPSASFADATEDEIDFLISTVGTGDCDFVRNGQRFSRRDARRHLQSKRRRNEHLIDSAEEFIEKIASGSITSGKPYLIRCKGQEDRPAGEWFAEQLDTYRRISN